MTPNLAIVRIQNQHWCCPPIPVPLFLLWIPVILLAPFILLALWVACLVGQVRFWPAMGCIWRLVCALPGTQVRVTAQGNHVNVRIL